MVKLSLSYFFVLVSLLSYSANRYWVSAGSSTWNTTANWSTTSGTGSGASVPGTSDVAIFDGAGGFTGNCTFDVNVSVAAMTVSAGYTGTIAQSTFTFTLGTTASSFSDGIFSGGNNSITSNGNFTISGTAFTSTSGTFTIGTNANFTLSSGSFIHNSGTFLFSNTTSTATGRPNFNNLTIDNTTGATRTLTIASGDSLKVNGTFVMSGNSLINIDTGIITAKGNITLTNTNTACGGSASLLINGTGGQLFTGPATARQARVPNVIINKALGTLTLSGIISVIGWTYTTGTVDPGTSTVVFFGTQTITGSLTLYNVSLIQLHPQLLQEQRLQLMDH